MEKEEIAKVLENEYNFEILESNYSSCFDFLVRNKNFCIFIKFYKNLNSLRKEVTEDLENLENFCETESIILSERTSKNVLENFIYLRKNIKVLNLETFKKYIETNFEIPVYRYGKIVVNIDYNKMKEERRKLGYSLNFLAAELNVSRKHLYEIEKGIKNPSYELAKKIEKLLNTRLIEKFKKEFVSSKIFYFNKFSSIKGIKKRGKKYLVPREDDKALKESEEIAKFLRLKII